MLCSSESKFKECLKNYYVKARLCPEVLQELLQSIKADFVESELRHSSDFNSSKQTLGNHSPFDQQSKGPILFIFLVLPQCSSKVNRTNIPLRGLSVTVLPLQDATHDPLAHLHQCGKV